MPMRRKDYPPNWEDLRATKRRESGGRCQCEGECGLHRTHPGPRRCSERQGFLAVWARGIIVLTTAHLCHDTKCADLTHLKMMCPRCHIRYDREHHAANRAKTLAQRKAAGTLPLFPEPEP